MLVVLAGAAVAQDSPRAPPVQALKRLYEADPAFRATLDRAFANMQDPDPDARALWPTPRVENPWKGKKFDDLLAFFDDWYRLLPEPDGVRDEFSYIEKFAWFYYRNEDGQRFVGTQPGLGWTGDFVAARGRFLDCRNRPPSFPNGPPIRPSAWGTMPFRRRASSRSTSSSSAICGPARARWPARRMMRYWWRPPIAC